MKILGVTGPAGAGKDTIAWYLAREYNYRRLAFADPIYEGLAAILDVDEAALRNRDNKDRPLDLLGVSPRRMLQTLGTEWGREIIAEDFWLRLVDYRMSHMPGEKIVIPDVRFQNELDFIHARGGAVISVYRDVEAVAAHTSENPEVWEAADARINNTGPLDDLWPLIDLVMSGIGAN